MTESTLPAPVVGEDDKASLHPSDAHEPAGHPGNTGATAAAPAAKGVPPALETVTVSELLAAQELTTTTLLATPPPETGKGGETSSSDAPGVVETVRVAELARAEKPEAPAAEAGTRAAVADHPPAETRSELSTSPADAAKISRADGVSPPLPMDATSALASLSPDAWVATPASAPTRADAEPGANLPDARNHAEPHTRAAAAPGPIAVDRISSLTAALEDAARVAAERETVAAATGRTEPAPDASVAAPESPALAPVPPAAAGASAQPLTSAFDAAVKLAADANAAAEALESLKRLLQRQQQGVATGLAPLPASPADSAAWTPVPPKRTEPPPIPSLALPASDDGSADDESDDEPQLPAPLTRKRTPERVRFDLRGFLAGFALSWAFGVVLYLFMTAG